MNVFVRGLLFKGLAAALAISVAGIGLEAAAAPRIKDIGDFEGIRDNLLVGYGLVIGLNGTGDSLRNSPFTRQSLTAMLERLGVNTRGDANLNTKNVSAVVVTANLPPFARQGTRIDVTVSTLGDTKSLQGGVLLVTPLLGADGEVYAVAQGSVAVGGFVAQGAAETITRGVPTGGRMSNGAIVEREVAFDFSVMSSVKISLRNPDLTTAQRMAESINQFLGSPASFSLDPATVEVIVPASYGADVIGLLTELEQLEVTPDQAAKIVVDENKGIIVIGANVRVDEIAIAQGNLTIRITETAQVSQPNALAKEGETVIVPRTTIAVDDDEDKRLTVIKPGATLQDLVDGLNALGIGPRDLISILQTIKAAGALQAEIVVL
jgi:flagellar P-ring protein precursor FlgI